MTHSKKLYWQFAGSVGLVIFMIIGYLVKFYEETLFKIDIPVRDFFVNHRSKALTDIFLWLTKFGNTVTITLLLVISLSLLYKYRYRIESIWLFINTALIAGLGNYLIKFLFHRKRPDVTHLVFAPHFSFPSGHAMASSLFYGTLILLTPLLIKKRNLRLLVQVGLASLIVLIGVSRIYLGVHYLSDIIGGFMLGGAWLCFTYPYFISYKLKATFRSSHQN